MIAWLEEKIGELLIWLWQWIVGLSYWFVLLTGIVAIILFVGTKDKKHLRYVISGFIIYILIQGANLCIR